MPKRKKPTAPKSILAAKGKGKGKGKAPFLFAGKSTGRMAKAGKGMFEGKGDY